MPGSTHIWSPDDWEDYCDGLFRERHGPTGFVTVPDRHRGDLGMEGYSIDGSGVIYQCYVTEANEVGERYAKQRDKMTKDLGKLVAKADRVRGLLGDNVMCFWALVVPLYDSKDLIVHARAKEQEMRERDLPFLADDFTIVLFTEDDFAAERAVLDRHGIATVHAGAPLTDADIEKSVADLKASESHQVTTMDEKLSRAKVSDVTDMRERMLRQVVDADNIREHLRVDFPSTSEKVLTQLGIEERAIISERSLDMLHKGSLLDVRERFKERMAANVRALGQDEADRLAHGQVGRWILECPLDFPETDA
jgi:hypothetical protein